MPRRIADDDEEEMPRRRRRGARAAAVEAEAERGLVMRVLLHSPKDTVAGVLAFAALGVYVFFGSASMATGGKPLPLGRPVLHSAG